MGRNSTPAPEHQMQNSRMSVKPRTDTGSRTVHRLSPSDKGRETQTARARHGRLAPVAVCEANYSAADCDIPQPGTFRPATKLRKAS